MKNNLFEFNEDTRVFRHYAFGAVALCTILSLTVLGLLQVVRTEAASRNMSHAITNAPQTYASSSTASLQHLNYVRFDPCKKD